jgi:pimeloyl-ACP methyl ester carboxylesterase
MAVANLSGVRLHYVEDGAGDPPLVFVHGWCCDLSYFQPQFDHFKAAHRVMAMDLRGCGRSDRPARGYDIPTLADDVAGLCRGLGLERAVIVGHSLGAMIALDMSLRHPSVVGAIVAVDPGPLAITPESRATFEALISALEGPESQSARADYIDRMFVALDDPERSARIKATMCSAPDEVAVGMLRGVVEWTGVGALRLCSVPMLIVLAEPGGGNDPSRLLVHNSSVKYGVTVGAGHFNQLEVPDQVNPMIERFLKSFA